MEHYKNTLALARLFVCMCRGSANGADVLMYPGLLSFCLFLPDFIKLINTEGVLTLTFTSTTMLAASSSGFYFHSYNVGFYTGIFSPKKT